MIPNRRNSSLSTTRNSRNVLLLSQTPPPSVTQPRARGNSASSSPIPQPRSRLSRLFSGEGSTNDGPARMYLLGTRVECRVPGWSKFYSGKVSAVNLDGSLMVSFDDGDLRDCIQLGQVYFETRNTPSSSPSRVKLIVGNQIEYFNDQKWYPGKIIEVQTNENLYDLILCDGRTIRNVPRDVLKIFIPTASNLIAHEEVDVLIRETRSWIRGFVNESCTKIEYQDESSGVICDPLIQDVEIRYPIINPQRLAEEEDCLDATPMILSMQERLSQSIEVGARVLITDKNGGALPKLGKADSAQVSIINFPLPADGLIESITFRLFEAPAEESPQLEVILFDREPIPVTRTHRLSSTESSNDEGGNSPQLGSSPSAQSSAEVAMTRFFVAPDLPYRPSRSQVIIDPHSRNVQTVKLSVPLRGSAGQYLGVKNRCGRLNIAYTPDKKKPGESWSEKSIEVFYMMPRMVPRPFAGGPHATRDWHGRAGWFAAMIVSDPVDAVDPGWQRRCEVDALSRRDGETETRKICWLINSLIKQDRISASSILFDSPAMIKALRRLCEVDDSVVELITKLCIAATPSSKISDPKKLKPFIRLQRTLRFKAYEMQVVQRGRLSNLVASFQSILRCLLVMKRLLDVVSTPQASVSSFRTRIHRFVMKPRLLESIPFILYHVKRDGLFVSHTDVSLIKQTGFELVHVWGEDPEENLFRTILTMSGPLIDTDLYFPEDMAKLARRWSEWTSPLEISFRSQINEMDSEEEISKIKDNRLIKNRDWLDDLERATTLLHSFARREPPPSNFVREQLTLWKQSKNRLRVESPHPIPPFSESQPERSWTVSIPKASRLRIEWLPQSRLQEGDGSAIIIECCDHDFYGIQGMPPAIERIEDDTFKIRVAKAHPYDPAEILKRSKEIEKKSFPPIKGLTNSAGDPVFVVVDRGGNLKFACAKCTNSPPARCCEGLGDVENIEGRIVNQTRGTWTCSLCTLQSQPCIACSLFPSSAAMNTIRARPINSFPNISKYEMFLKRTLVPGVPVLVGSTVRRFYRLSGENVVLTTSYEAPEEDPKQHTLSELKLVESPSNTPVFPSVFSNRPLGSPSFQIQTTPLATSTTSSNEQSAGGTFATNDLGPDIAISNNGLTVTRLRSVGWGTQRMSRYLDASCGVTTIVFKIDRNSSNHLFFGVVAPTFEDWSRRMMESGAWAIRRDGSIHADGRERTSATPDARLVNGETLTMIIDMISEPRTLTFLRGTEILGKLQGLPPRVVPAVSFGGSNQIVTIASFSLGNGSSIQGRPQSEWGFALDVIPEYDQIDPEEESRYVTDCTNWTIKQDRNLVYHMDEIASERKMNFSEVLQVSWEEFIKSSHFVTSLKQEDKTYEIIGERLEWIRAFNASVARALPLLDLSFDEETDTSVVRDLSECSHLLFEVVKRPMWEDALESTRTEEGQFEVVLDYGKALAHRQFVDTHGRFSVFAQAFRAMNSMPPSRLRGRGQLYRATLRGMRAHDDGGPYRQSFQTYCAELLSTPGTGLFLPCANRANEIHVNRDRWLPNPGAKSALQISMFEFVGKLMGIALRNHEFLDLRLPSLVWKWLVNRKPVFEDLRAVDLLFANTVQELTERKEVEDAWGEEPKGGGMNFTVYSLDGRVIELVPKGEQRAITSFSDRQEWVQLATQYKLNEFNEQLEAIRRGLAMVVPQRMLVLFSWEELELMVCGRPKN